MPTYEYVCEACEHRFERLQKISDRPVRACPECGARKVKRLISRGGGLLFKGSGFYATDYRKGTAPSDEGKAEKAERKESKERKERKEDAGSAKDAGEGTGS